MLKNSLIVKTRPVANKQNVVLWKEYRLTVLSNRLFRLEQDSTKTFRDGATQSIWYRDMPKQNFNVEISQDSASVTTDCCEVVLKENRKDCYIILNGKRLLLKNDKNLLGTYRTLDRCDGDIEYADPFDKNNNEKHKINLGNGVCSKKGVAILDDSLSLTLLDNGEIAENTIIEKDEYVFAFGNDYTSALKALYMISGEVPLIPRYALGNWWSRYHAYTDEEYLALLTKFKENDMPFTIATIDMDWHYSLRKEIQETFKVVEKKREDVDVYGNCLGWTGYTWNKRLFPDYKAFLKEISNLNLKITLNLHPADGVRWFESVYNGMAKAMGIDASSGKLIPFDITDTKFINAYFDLIHKPYEKDGVTFWWIDWQQGVKTKMAGLDPLWALNHYHYLDHAENHYSPLILSRYAGIGSHRYPLGFSGDTFVTWKSLKYIPYFTATASNVGFIWWSHDIGGHMLGYHDNELYLRYVQFGTFSPINRLHSTSVLVSSKEPWNYSNGSGEIAKKFLKLRHSLIPYIYTHSYLANKNGLAFIKPLYYIWNNENAFKYKNEYVFGNLLVAPITSKIKKDGFARVKIYLPEGRWTDIFTNEKYTADKNGKELVLYRRLESVPVLIKDGGILPISLDKGNSIKNPTIIEVNVFSGNGAFTLYEDGHEDENNSQLFTYFVSKLEKNNDNCKEIFTISSAGDSSIVPQNRVFRIVFKDIEKGSFEVFKNDVKIEIKKLYNEYIALELPYEIDSSYKIIVDYKAKTEITDLIHNATKTIITLEDIIDAKNNAFNLIKTAQTVNEYKEYVEKSKLKPINKLKLTEYL